MTAARRRLVALVSSSADHGGAERYLELVAGALAGSGAVAALVGDRADPRTVDALTAAGAAVRVVRGLARQPDAAAALWLAGALHRLGPDLVHVNLTDQGDGLTAAAAVRIARLPRVATLHLVLPGRRPPLEAVSRVALRGLAPVIAVSDGVAGHLARAGIRTTVVRNGVPAPSPAARPREQLWGADPPRLLAGGIGRLDRQKGWDVLCAAAPRIRDAVPAAGVVVVGDGPERAALEAAGASAGVRFAGPRPDAASLLAGLDVLVIPSRYEGLSLTAIEGLAAGRAIVAADVPGLREAVGECGILVPAGDPAALAGAVTALLADDERRARLGRAGAARAAERFGVDRMLRETLAVHEQVLGRA
jgi:glycosyltransferase involved in cell wall biosynthesis